MRLPVWLLDPAVPSNPSATPRTGEDRAEAEMDATDAGPPVWPDGKVFAEARTAVWTEMEAGVRTGAHGKVFAEAGIMSGTSAWAEVGAELRPIEGQGGDLPMMPREPAAWLGQEKLPTRGEGEQEQAAFSSVLSMLAGQGPAMGKPLGLLSKAAWTKSSSSLSSKASSSSSSSTIKASSLPSSSSPASNRDSQTPGSDIAPTAINSSSSNSNSSSSLGIVLCFLFFNTSQYLSFYLTSFPGVT